MLIKIIARRARRRPRGGPLLLGLLLVLLGLAFGPAWPASKSASKSKRSSKSKTSTTDQKKAAPTPEDTEPFLPGHPLLLLSGLHCQVHREGVVRQDFVADKGRYDEIAHVMDLTQMQARFLDQGTTVAAQLQCGTGRIWTADRPAEDVAAHDMLLQEAVRVHTNNNVMLQSPEMRFTAADTTLHTDKGFLKQLPSGSVFMVGRGQGFDIELNMENNKFKTWSEYGTPQALGELRKSDKPVIKP